MPATADIVEFHVDIGTVNAKSFSNSGGGSGGRVRVAAGRRRGSPECAGGRDGDDRKYAVIDRGTVPARYRGLVPKEYERYIPFEKQ